MTVVWREAMLMTLLVSLNPFFLAMIVLQISRPRPVANLLAYWAGCMITNVPIFVVPLLALNGIPTFASFARHLAASDSDSAVNPLKIGTSVLAFSLAALFALHHRSRRRKNAAIPVSAGGGGGIALEDDPDPPAATSGLQRRVNAAVTRVQSVVSRAKDEWENGNPRLALLFGMGCVPSLTMVLLVDTLIFGSGAAIGMQVMIGMFFVLAMFVVPLIAVLGYLVAPSKAESVLRPLHDWSAAHTLQIVVTLLLAIGVWSLVAGLGIV